LTYVLVTSLAMALLLATAALIHQVRLRRALEALLKRLLSYWRNYATHPKPTAPADHPDAQVDDRMRHTRPPRSRSAGV
jgi:hypothetical protein